MTNPNGAFPSPARLREMLADGEILEIRDSIAAAHPHTAARRLDVLPDEVVWNILRRTDRETAAAVFSHLPISRQVRLARKKNIKEIAELLRHMAPDDRVDVLQGLDNTRRGQVLAELPEPDRAVTEKLASYPDDSVGSVMIPMFFAVASSMTVAEAIRSVRDSSRRSEHIHTLYVTDADGVLVGDISLVELLRSDAASKVADIMHTGTVTVRVDDPRKDAAEKVRGFDLLEVAVVDSGSRLVGLVTVDDALEVIEQETSDTIYQKAGVGDLVHQKDHVFSEKLTRGGILYPIRVRILYLLVALAGGMAVGGLIDFWEDTLAAVIAAAVFIPVIMDMGGNTGTQSTTIFARGFALGHVDLKRFVPYLLRECSIGLVMGAALGTIGGVIAYFWQGAPNGVPQLGFAVGFSLFVVITVAAMLGFILPALMVRLGLDHAPGADPFITTIKDFTGLALYFFLVSTLIAIEPDPDPEHASAILSAAASTLAALTA
ncbi:MAG: magnesium transporter [Phycisphaerales bacterium]|nr:MAG: magnesium transporter [Phycisphaerales bacterium]